MKSSEQSRHNKEPSVRHGREKYRSWRRWLQPRLSWTKSPARPFATTLTGAAEVPGPGDPDGSGTAELTLNPGQGEVCFELVVSGIEPAAAAHIHRGGTTVAGPVVVGLTPPTSGSSKACVSADRDLINEIIQNPDGFYVNVHNAVYPAGALRGQLSK